MAKELTSREQAMLFDLQRLALQVAQLTMQVASPTGIQPGSPRVSELRGEVSRFVKHYEMRD